MSDGAGRGGWYTVVMLSLVAVMSQIDRGVLALFVQPIKRDYHLTDFQVSILLGFAFTFFYVVGGLPLSRLADRGVRKNVIAGCLAVWSIATALCSLAQGFWGFFVSRAVIGGTEAGCGPASLSTIADAVPREKLPRAFAIYNTGFSGGSALSLLFGGLLIGMLANVAPIPIPGIGTMYNWQLVFILLGIPGLLLAIVVRTTVKEPVRKGAAKRGGYPISEILRYVWSQRALHMPLLLGVFFMNVQLYGIASWLPAFYERTYGWGPAIVGPSLGLVGLVASTLGLFIGARLAEVMSKTRDDANLRALFLAQSLSIPFMVAGPLMPSPWLALGCMAVGGLLSTMGGSGFNAALNAAMPNAMRGQVIAFYFIVNNAIAGSFAPMLVAFITDYVVHSEAALRYVIVGLRVMCAPLTVIFLWRALKPYAKVYRERLEADEA